MKKKLMTFIMIALFFSLSITTLLFVIITNYEYMDNVKQQLILNNKININLIKSGNLNSEKLLFENSYKGLPLRLTYIDKDGKVLQDSMADAETMVNHNNRPEVIQARESGIGSSVRYSDTVKKNLLYVATEFNDGYIIRSAEPIEFISVFQQKYVRYYVVTMLLVVIAAIFLAMRFSRLIVDPVKKLEFITSRVARGELNQRVSVITKDEVGQLGRTFNDMADKLQATIKDSLDKQYRLEAILKSMDSGVIAVDRNNKIIMINPYAKKIFGIYKDIIGQNLMDHIRNFEIENVFRESNDGYTQIKILWPTERELRIKTADIISENHHIGTVAVVQDITDLKRLENMRTEFVANVSHELKTPLTSIKGFAETLRFVDDPVNKDKFLNIIDDEVERLTRLINDILTLSDIELHKSESKEEINVNEVIKNVYNLVKNSADKKNININITGEKVDKISGETDDLLQMLINLVDNAIKYSEENASITIETKQEEGFCFVSVEDTGVGIPKDHINRIFERFYRVDKARSRARGGTGLGLAIVKHLVLNFKGSIEVKSEVGVGSKFIVKLPTKINVS